ncbi:MAG: hypothetical protein RH942_03865 [Kiloniellaceae bacterium]
MGSDDEVQVHLAEYRALREEAGHYSQRIDRMSGVYLTALFGIAGYLLRPDSGFDLDSYMASVQESKSLTLLFLFLTILNSVLLLRIGSFFSGLLAITQYVHYVVRPRLSSILNQEVLKWDDAPRLSAKRIWIPLRSVGQGLFIVIAEALSFVILLNSVYVVDLGWRYLGLYAVSWALLLGSLVSLFAVALAGAWFHQPGRLSDSLSVPPE